jgi:glycosyltransferase involved in cell wall biosynthesis
VSLQSLHIVTTVPVSLYTLLEGQPRRLSEQYVVTLVSSPGPELEATGKREKVRTHAVRMTRRISPLADLRSLWQLTRWFRAYTPKAGLLAMGAARLAGVQIRVHGIVGMPLMEATGFRRRVLNTAERLTYGLSTHLTCNSPALGRWVEATLRPRREITVLMHGSINGIDTTRLIPPDEARRTEQRRALGLAADVTVFAFVGRLVRAKGVEELLEAFRLLRCQRDDVLLLLVGDEEPCLDPLSTAARLQVAGGRGVDRLSWQRDVRHVYEAIDVLVLPSYREGLPNTLLEASACGVPCIASLISGCNEVVLNNKTGLLVPVGNVEALKAAMTRLVDPELRASFGRAGRDRTTAQFDSQNFWRALLEYYSRISNSRSRTE